MEDYLADQFTHYGLGTPYGNMDLGQLCLM